MLVGSRVLNSPMEVELGSLFEKRIFGKFSEILMLKNNVIAQVLKETLGIWTLDVLGFQMVESVPVRKWADFEMFFFTKWLQFDTKFQHQKSAYYPMY